MNYRTLALLLLAVLLPAQLMPQGSFMQNRRAAFRSITTSYDPPLGSGDRTATQTMTFSAGLIHAGSPQDFIDGVNPEFGFYFFGTYAALDELITCDYGPGASVLVQELRWIQHTAANQGTWQFEISDDLSTWTPVGSTFSICQSSGTDILNAMAANTTPCRAWRLRGISGNVTNLPYLYELEVKCATVP